MQPSSRGDYKELYGNGANPMQPRRAFPSFAECMKSICHQSLSGGCSLFPKLKSLACGWEHKGQAPELASARFHLLLHPLQLGHRLASATVGELRLLKNGVSAKFLGPGQHQLFMESISVSAPSLGFPNHPADGGEKKWGNGAGFGSNSARCIGNEKKKKMGPKKGTKARKGLWSGSGESSPRVRALLPLALGDLGSFILVPYDTFA